MPKVIIEELSTNVSVAQTVVHVKASLLAQSFATVAAAADMDMSGARDGALVSYRASTQKFEPTRLITISSGDPFGGNPGDIWLKFKPA